jgi:glycosyltransferase involved in cell wall biosynthesis
VRILHLTTFLQGGAGRVIADLAVAQSRGGHDVSVVTSRTGAPGYGNYAAYLDELGAAGVELHLVDSMFHRDPRANLDVVSALNSTIAYGREPHVLHAHAATPASVSLLFAGARRYRAVIVQTMHGWGVTKTADQAAADIAVMNLIDRVAVPSNTTADRLIALGVDADRLDVIPYGVNHTAELLDAPALEIYQVMRRARANGSLVLACIGTIGARKNQALLVRALAHVGDRAPIFCVFIGDGDLPGLTAEIARAGVEERTFVHGYNRAARRLASAADVLVLPSRSEGLPIAVLEAFCDGPLVLVSDIPELAELVDDGATGLRFAADDAASLAGRLIDASRISPSVRRAIQHRARARYLDQFTAPAMHAAYMTFYEAACHPVSWQTGILPAA